MWIRSSLFAGALLVVMLCRPALADDPMTLVFDGRQCSASFSGNGAGSSWDLPTAHFAPFLGGTNLIVDNGTESWNALSSQVSSTTSSVMRFEGGATADVQAVPTSYTLQSRGQSKFDVTFTVVASTPYRLTGQVGESGYADSTARVVLTSVAPGNPVVESIVSGADSVQSFSRLGVLQPGTYRLFAEANAHCRTNPPQLTSQATTSCSFEFNTDIRQRCPADWNSDGLVNSADFFDFLNDYMSNNADFNGDGVTNSLDFFAFLNEYLTGC